ncbi:MAG: hypothetical protein ACI9K2_006636 [Myxococcota bacterium]|jgi:hypothetical protein
MTDDMRETLAKLTWRERSGRWWWLDTASWSVLLCALAESTGAPRTEVAGWMESTPMEPVVEA